MSDEEACKLLRVAQQSARRRRTEKNVVGMLRNVPLALSNRHVTAPGNRVEDVTTYVKVATSKDCGCVFERQSVNSRHVLMPIARGVTLDIWLTEDGQLVLQENKNGQPPFRTISVQEISDQLLEAIGQDLRKLGKSTGRRR